MLKIFLAMFGSGFRARAAESALLSPVLSRLILRRVAAVLAAFAVVSFYGPSESIQAQKTAPPPPIQAQATAEPDFSPISKLVNDAIAAKKLPGAVVLVGHDGKVVFEQAYGNRKLAGEPGLDGQPSPAEPMTTDTIFDMASLTKCLATATAMMRLYDQGRYQFDDPVAKYLPEFAANGKEKVTIRELLTHYSGLPEDVNLKDPWGLAAPDKAEGIRRAMESPLANPSGVKFEYSDINFIVLGALVERLSGESLDEYALKHIFEPLGMKDTRFLPPQSWLPRIAPTAHNDDGPMADGRLLRGVVHDPTARRMGGVAGHAGVFSTAHDMSLFAQALLDKLVNNTGSFPVSQSTLERMIMPQQPGGSLGQLEAATDAESSAIARGDKPAQPGLAPHYPAIANQNLRGFAWDIDTAFSKPRGLFPVGTFGHTGFTGTSIWIDPARNTYVILLANAIHPRGNPPISNLRGEVATAAMRALDIYPCGLCPLYAVCDCVSVPAHSSEADKDRTPPMRDKAAHEWGARHTLTGIDVLERDNFTDLAEIARRHGNRLRLGLLTNQSGLDSDGRRTIDLLATEAPRAVPGLVLTTLFSPEHGIFGRQDTTSIAAETDPTTHLPVVSLYGAKDSDRRPSHEQLKNLDAVVIDIQDAGVRFYTYEAAVGYFLEAAAEERRLGRSLEIIVLDRPNILGGEKTQGPVSDEGHDSYTNYMPLPIRHGMTLGELARYINGERRLPSGVSPNILVPLQAQLTVVPMRGWRRTMYFDDTSLPWTPPSPNLRNMNAAVLYPGVALLETTNVSVGRGSGNPFEQFGAPWIDAAALADYLTRRRIPGVSFTATTFFVNDDKNHYPWHGQTIPAVRMEVTDRDALDSPELGVELLSALNALYPRQFELAKASRLLVSVNTMLALQNHEDPRRIAASWQSDLDAFRRRRQPYLIYSDNPTNPATK